MLAPILLMVQSPLLVQIHDEQQPILLQQMVLPVLAELPLQMPPQQQVQKQQQMMIWFLMLLKGLHTAAAD